MKPMKKIALLHSMCSVGKASLTNMLPVLSTMGIEACPIPTVLLSTHTRGFGDPVKHSVEAEYIRSCANHYKQNGERFDLIFVGYLGNENLVSAVQYFLDSFPEATVVLDPILGDHGKFYSSLGPEYIGAFQILIPYADIILPNLTEGCLLTDIPYADDLDEDNISEICQRLKQAGAKKVIVTSIPSVNEQVGLALSMETDTKVFALSKEKEDFHGSGDLFDAVLVGSLLNGISIEDGIRKAHEFVCVCVRESSSYDYPKREGLLIEKNLSLLV